MAKTSLTVCSYMWQQALLPNQGLTVEHLLFSQEVLHYVITSALADTCIEAEASVLFKQNC